MMRMLAPSSQRDLPADWQQRLERRARVIAVIAVRGSAAQTAPYPGGMIPVPAQDPGRVTRQGVLEPNSQVLLTDRLRPDGTLDWTVPGDGGLPSDRLGVDAGKFPGSLREVVWSTRVGGADSTPGITHRFDRIATGSATRPVHSGRPRRNRLSTAALLQAGYDFDPVNTDGLLQSHVEAGTLVTPGGLHYRVLILPRITALRAETAERIAAFAKAGLPVVFVGEVPNRDEGLNDFERRDARVSAAVRDILSTQTKLERETELPESLRRREIVPNLTFLDGTNAAFIEKRSGERRLFFLTNPDAAARRVSFQVSGHAGAAIWDAWNGTIRAQPTIPMDGGVRVDLQLGPFAAALVVFDPRQPAVGAPVASSSDTGAVLEVGAGGWRFQAQGFNANGASISQDRALSHLEDWTATADLQDFAGQGRYTTTLRMAPGSVSSTRRSLLDLGEVHDVVQVRVNGRAAVILAFPPYRIDVTDALRVGTNSVEISVANTPFNATRRPNTAARPAGLLGPVVLRAISGGLLVSIRHGWRGDLGTIRLRHRGAARPTSSACHAPLPTVLARLRLSYGFVS